MATSSTDSDEDLDVYDSVFDCLLSMPHHLVLAQATYGQDFVRHVVANNVWDYRSAHTPSQNFDSILIGEIRPATCGTRFSARGNHYMGSQLNPTKIEDKTRVKSVFILGKPTAGPQGLRNLFDNQLITLCDVIEQDKVSVPGKNLTVKEWTSRAGSDASVLPDYIHVVTEPMYVASPSTQSSDRNARSPKKKKLVSDRTNSHDVDSLVSDDAHSRTAAGPSNNKADDANDSKYIALTTNMLYPPNVLPDYGGDLFSHVHAKLRQLDIRNVDDELVHPQDWYSKLRQGTLVMVRASLHAFTWDNRRVYQLTGHTIRALVPSELEIEEHKVTVLNPEPVNASSSSEAAALLSSVVLGKRAQEEMAL
ncbi:hypothetical protein L210DRAFT_866829 [Boletus edulis BED1]|uniref:Uncharacterized protein n=1 Tax=Boletus edulis BED1 TaxID=1328754 RepID=A0AAD4BRY8_BOLED|nr:hypothetical protein L210DRAFT_866829 [Boletus edulis BED1]